MLLSGSTLPYVGATRKKKKKKKCIPNYKGTEWMFLIN
jgi:hypothetical protein